jgi:ATP-binding cassette subfamily B (MDR/TAP) protein 1
MLFVGTAGGIDAGIEVRILKVHAQGSAFVEAALRSIRAIHGYNLSLRIATQYAAYLEDGLRLGQKKNVLYGVLFSGEYSILFAIMGLAFWQGINFIARGEIDSIGTVFT